MGADGKLRALDARGGGYYESSTGSIQVNSERIVEQLRETVKCWVKDAIREMKEEETNG